MHIFNGMKDVIFIKIQSLCLIVQFVGEDIEQNFGIRVRVDMPTILTEQFLLELCRVSQVAVMRQGDAIRGIDVKRLCLC